MLPQHSYHYFDLNHRSQIGLEDELAKTWTLVVAEESKVVSLGFTNRFETSAVSGCLASFPSDWACVFLFLFAFCAYRKVLLFCVQEKIWVFLLDELPRTLFLECLSRLKQKNFVLAFLQHPWKRQSFSMLGLAYSSSLPRTCLWWSRWRSWKCSMGR